MTPSRLNTAATRLLAILLLPVTVYLWVWFFSTRFRNDTLLDWDIVWFVLCFAVFLVNVGLFVSDDV